MTFVNNLKGYRLIYSAQAQKMLAKLPQKVARKIYSALEALVGGQPNVDVKKLHEQNEPRYRLRVGDYRIVYVAWEMQVIVYVIEIGHRKEIYRK